MTTSRPPDGFHRHQCPTCFCVWQHADYCALDNPRENAHTCPDCGTEGVTRKLTDEYGDFDGELLCPTPLGAPAVSRREAAGIIAGLVLAVLIPWRRPRRPAPARKGIGPSDFAALMATVMKDRELQALAALSRAEDQFWSVPSGGYVMGIDPGNPVGDSSIVRVVRLDD